MFLPLKRGFLNFLFALFLSRLGSPCGRSATSRSSTRRSQGKNSLCASHISNPAVRAAHPSDPRRGSLSLSSSSLRLRGAQSFPLLYPLINESGSVFNHAFALTLSVFVSQGLVEAFPRSVERSAGRAQAPQALRPRAALVPDQKGPTLQSGHARRVPRRRRRALVPPTR